MRRLALALITWLAGPCKKKTKLPMLRCLRTARLLLMSSKAGFTQPPRKLAVVFFNSSIHLWMWRVTWLEMMRFPGLMLGYDGGKRNPPVGRLTRGLRKICPLPSWGITRARSDYVQAYNAFVPLPQTSCSLPDDVISVDGLWSTYCGRLRVWTDS